MIRQRKMKVHIINLWPKICVVTILFTFLAHLTYYCIHLFPQISLICLWLIDSLQYQNQIYFKYQFYSKYHKLTFLFESQWLLSVYKKLTAAKSKMYPGLCLALLTKTKHLKVTVYYYSTQTSNGWFFWVQFLGSLIS